MCGRYVVFSDQDIVEMNAIVEEVNRKFGEGSSATGEIFPTNRAPVFVAGEGQTIATLMTWGFPQYTGKGVIINARSETAFEKRTFSSALQTRRCVIPSTGFYEWAKPSKEKYLFNLPDSPMLYMAGLYTPDPEGLPRYVILTTAANNSMKEIHDRMPVLLRQNEIPDWTGNHDNTAAFLSRVPPELVKKKVS